MAGEAERRFNSIMDKLFTAPKFKSTLSEVESSRGKKRQNPMSVVTVAESKSRGDIQHSSTPLCRPWDRGDLMQRLATFKSMTWFAKPEVVSAINCARRGWVNVDMDIIACEACGARLLFSAPSSWTRQQGIKLH
uniref:C3HC-type domain-containing protein n=1 Tax=Vitis vinifera TaxID=29760 RepID=F6I083_VITVI